MSYCRCTVLGAPQSSILTHGWYSFALKTWTCVSFQLLGLQLTAGRIPPGVSYKSLWLAGCYRGSTW